MAAPPPPPLPDKLPAVVSTPKTTTNEPVTIANAIRPVMTRRIQMELQTKSKQSSLSESNEILNTDSENKAADIYDVASKWGEARKFTRSASGSAGVFIVHFDTGLVVVKGSSSIGQEAFVAHLARKLNITVPRCRIVEYCEAEWKELKNALFRLARQQDSSDTLKVEKELNRPNILIMEYVSGIELPALGPKAAEVFSGPSGANRLKEIGKIVALDIVTNNWDRLPIIWDHEGNPGNLFVQYNGNDGRIVGIDQGLTCINQTVSKVGYDRYVDKIQKLIQAILNKPTSETEGVKKVRELIALFTGYDFGVQGSFWIQMGILEGAVKFIGISLEELDAMKKEISDWVRTDWENVWLSMMKLIDTTFLFNMISIFKSHEAKIREVLSKQDERAKTIS